MQDASNSNSPVQGITPALQSLVADRIKIMYSSTLFWSGLALTVRGVSPEAEQRYRQNAREAVSGVVSAIQDYRSIEATIVES